jgi:hypothetical protein
MPAACLSKYRYKGLFNQFTCKGTIYRKPFFLVIQAVSYCIIVRSQAVLKKSMLSIICEPVLRSNSHGIFVRFILF